MENGLAQWPCPYLDPETVRRVNADEIHTIVDIGSCNGIDAVRLSNYYECPCIVFESDAQRTQAIHENIFSHPRVQLMPLETWEHQASTMAIDLLCIDVPECLQILRALGTRLCDVKYIVISKNSLSSPVKSYLMTQGFRSFFDGVDLFSTVLFVHGEQKNNTKWGNKKIHPPTLDPLIPGNKHSELIHGSFTDNHDLFHTGYFAPELDVNYQDSHGNTALIIAAAIDAPYPLQKLLQLNATDCSIKNEDGCTALMLAAALGKIRSVNRLLLDPRGRASIDMTNSEGMNAEEIAQQEGFSEIVNSIKLKNFNTPVLHPSVVHTKCPNITYAWLQHEIADAMAASEDHPHDTQAQPKIENFMTSLRKFFGWKDEQQLPEAAPEEQTKNVLQSPPEEVPSSESQTDLINIPNLLKVYGIDENHQDCHGNTALIIAAAYNDVASLEELLQIPTVNCALRNDHGCTALMAAAALGHGTVVNKLLDHCQASATIGIVNKMKMDAEELARRGQFSDIVDLITLKKYGSLEIQYPQHVISSKVLICGVCRDVEVFLPTMIQNIEKIGNLFEDYRVVIYENNSVDATQNILRNWMAVNPNVTIKSESISQDSNIYKTLNRDDRGYPFKTETIARARNILLDEIMLERYDAYPYVIVVDMDFLSFARSEGIIEVFESKREWDAVFAYSTSNTEAYWDWYAFRDFNEPLGPELLGADWFVSKHWSLNKDSEWCPVYSAFGGLGIYKRESMRGCKYSGVVTPDLEKIAKKIIHVGRVSNHPAIVQYLMNTQKLKQTVNICASNPHFPCINDPMTGILLNNDLEALTWRMNSHTCNYPVVCEHVPFHASMITHGRGKLFINPRLTFYYAR